MKIIDLHNEKNQVTNIRLIETNKALLSVNEKFKTVFFKFEEGKGLPNHSHNGEASIYIFSGRVYIEFLTGEKFELKTGDFLPFDARIEHNVIALEESKVIVTIGQASR